MCNLYSNTTNQEAMRRLFKVAPADDHLGNFAPTPAIRPNAKAPVCRLNTTGARELVSMHWGIAKAKWGWVTNLRHLDRPPAKHDVEKIEQRCLVPATSFAEYHPIDQLPPSRPGLKPRKAAAWFALTGEEERPLFAFAGIWKRFKGERRKGEFVECDAFAFLTTDANGVVGPIHKDAMPVILDPEDYDAWLKTPAADAVKLQKPLPDEALRIAFIGETSDG